MNVGNVFGFPTNRELTRLASQVASVKTGIYSIIEGNGNINMFANGVSAISSFSAAFPGYSGARNQIRGEGSGFGSGLGQALAGVVERKAEPAVPLGSVQRDEYSDF